MGEPAEHPGHQRLHGKPVAVRVALQPGEHGGKGAERRVAKIFFDVPLEGIVFTEYPQLIQHDFQIQRVFRPGGTHQGVHLAVAELFEVIAQIRFRQSAAVLQAGEGAGADDPGIGGGFPQIEIRPGTVLLDAENHFNAGRQPLGEEGGVPHPARELVDAIDHQDQPTLPGRFAQHIAKLIQQLRGLLGRRGFGAARLKQLLPHGIGQLRRAVGPQAAAYETVNNLSAGGQNPMGQQAGFARTRAARQDQGLWMISEDVCLEGLQIACALDKGFPCGVEKLRLRFQLLLQGRSLLQGFLEAVAFRDRRLHIGDDPVAQRRAAAHKIRYPPMGDFGGRSPHGGKLRGGAVFIPPAAVSAARPSGARQGVFPEFPKLHIVPLGIVAAFVGIDAAEGGKAHVFQVAGIAQIEESAGEPIRLKYAPAAHGVDDGMDDLHFRHGLAQVAAQLGKFPEGLGRNIAVRGNPAAALADEAQKEGAAAVDVFQANLHRAQVFGGILLGNAPAQVNIPEPEPPLGAPLVQFGEHPLHQVIAFGVHIVEGAADEHVYVPPMPFALVLFPLVFRGVAAIKRGGFLFFRFLRGRRLRKLFRGRFRRGLSGGFPFFRPNRQHRNGRIAQKELPHFT